MVEQNQILFHNISEFSIVEHMQNEVPLSMELPCWEVSELHIPSIRQERMARRGGMGEDSPGGVCTWSLDILMGQRQMLRESQTARHLVRGLWLPMNWAVLSTSQVQKVVCWCLQTTEAWQQGEG